MAIVSLGHPAGNRARTDIPQPGIQQMGVRRSSWVAATRAFASSRRVKMLTARRAPPSRHFCSLPPDATTMRACTLWIWLLMDPWIRPDSFGSTDDISVPADGDRCWCPGPPAEDVPLGTCRGEPTSRVIAPAADCAVCWRHAIRLMAPGYQGIPTPGRASGIHWPGPMLPHVA
jgi:hypothetical protein